MSLQDVLTLEPFKTESGTLVRNTGVQHVKGTGKWVNREYKHYTCVHIRRISDNKMQYWIFNRENKFVKSTKVCPE